MYPFTPGTLGEAVPWPQVPRVPGVNSSSLSLSQAVTESTEGRTSASESYRPSPNGSHLELESDGLFGASPASRCIKAPCSLA